MRVGTFIRILVATGTVAGWALADLPSQIGRVDVTCPVCSNAFSAYTILRSNTFGGVDRDLFARSIGAQVEFYRVSTCPRCAFSGHVSDFAADAFIPPFVVRQILDPPGLAPDPPIDDDADQDRIAPAQRYRLAIACYKLLGRSEEARAWLAMRAAWVTRDTAAILPPAPPIPRLMAIGEAWLPPQETGANQADRELVLATEFAARLSEGRFVGGEEPAARAVLAMLLRLHGENAQSAELLESLFDEPRLPAPVREACRRMLESIDVEAMHQRDAAALLRRALFVGQVSEANRGPATYLLGELYRRLGDATEALTWFRKALAMDGLDPNLRAWTAEQMASIETPLGE
jgi:uncharacterized protein (DUF2225 family)